MDGLKLIAMVNNCQQYSPDDFESKPDILELSDDTTIQDLLNWQKQQNTDARNKGFAYDNFRQIHILPVKSN
jgi:hypothetical protein